MSELWAPPRTDAPLGPLLWCVFLMKRSSLLESLLFASLFTFVLRKPSNRSQLKVKIFRFCLLSLKGNTGSSPLLPVVAVLV